MCVHSEQTKQVALLFAQSKLKKDATAVLSCAWRVQNKLLLQTGQIKSRLRIEIVCGSFWPMLFSD